MSHPSHKEITVMYPVNVRRMARNMNYGLFLCGLQIFAFRVMLSF